MRVIKFYFLLLILLLATCECVRIRKRNKMRRDRQQAEPNNVTTSDMPISQPPELIEIIELDTLTLPPTDITSTTTLSDESKKLVVNEEIKSLIQTLKTVMRTSPRPSLNTTMTTRKITTTTSTKKPSTISSYEMKKIHLDAPPERNKMMYEKKQLIAKSAAETPKYIELDCKFGNMTDYLSIEHSNRHLYTCESFNLRVLHENTKVSSIFGQHEDGLTNNDVIALRNVFTRSPFLPQSIHQHFPHLKHLYVPSTRVQFVSRKNFAGMSGLLTLDLRFNEIEFFAADTFLDLFSLNILSLGGNFLKKIPSNVFSNMLNLRFLDLSDNELVLFDDEILSTNTEMEEVLLNHNQIRAINSNFERFKDIGFIDLRGNLCIDTLYLRDHPDFPLLFEFQEEINYNCTRRNSRAVPKLLPGTQIKNELSWEICSHLIPNSGKMCLTERRRSGDE